MEGRGRIRVVGFDASVVEERDELVDWGSDGDTTKSRMDLAWRRFKRNRTAIVGLAIILAMVLITIFAKQIQLAGVTIQPIELAPKSTSEPNFGALSQEPTWVDPVSNGNFGALLESSTWEHPLGTDWAGRDSYSRHLYGGRFSLSIGFIAVGIAVLVGVPMGAIGGYYGGWVDEVVMRLVDILYAFPFLVLAVAIIAVLGQGYYRMILALVIVGWIGYARLIRGEILSVKENEYVTAAKALGASNRSIIFRHIVPNAMAPVIVQATLNVGTIVLAAAALGFLGLGLEPGTAEWGSMLSNGRETLIQGQWWVTIFPGLAIFLFVLSINLVGDGVRDAFDPQGETRGQQRRAQ
ncbi:MAG: ABC transporter permease [Halobacteriales archaeon]